MELQINEFDNGGPIPAENCFCIPAAKDHVTLAANKNPTLRWSGVPEATKSFALICVDVDAPTVADDVNQEGKKVAADLPRGDFYHWALTDIPVGVTEIAAGSVSDGVTPKGKEFGKTNIGIRGLNDYTSWFEGDTEMEGSYGGYDSPCPPWNDERIHHYHFRVYALDIDALGLEGPFRGGDVINAMDGHILDSAEWVGSYTLNPDLV